MDLTRKKQVIKWQTSPVSVFKLRHCGPNFFNASVSSRSWEFEKMEPLGLVLVLKTDRLSFVSVLWMECHKPAKGLAEYWDGWTDNFLHHHSQINWTISALHVGISLWYYWELFLSNLYLFPLLWLLSLNSNVTMITWKQFTSEVGEVFHRRNVL